MELQQADIQNWAEIEQLQGADDANKKEINSLWDANKQSKIAKVIITFKALYT